MKVKQVFGVLMIVFGVTISAEAQFRALSIDQVCKKSQLVGSESSTIYKNSAPLRAGGVGTPLVGYRKEPTLIFNANNFSGGSFTIYDSEANSLARCPYASAEGHRGRARCTIQTAALRRAAVKNTGSARVYFKVNKNNCVEIPDAGRCYGSVKGLCNQVIK
jgi:hypothetical protein